MFDKLQLVEPFARRLVAAEKRQGREEPPMQVLPACAGRMDSWRRRLSGVMQTDTVML